MSVLITGSEIKHAVAITQSLGKEGIAVSCLSPNPSASPFYSKYCQEHFVSPALENKDSYINFLFDIVKKKKYDLLIPCTDLATEYISEAREILLPYVRFLLPDHETIMLALNKDKMMRFCQEKGFSIPRTIFPKNIEDITKLDSTLDYPLVLKGARGASADNVKYAKSKDELIDKYIELKDRASNIIIQEYIFGDNYDFYGLCNAGVLLSFFMFKTLRSYPVTGGTPSKAVSIYDVKLKEFAARIVGELNWSGMFNMDFIKDRRDGEYKFLEINPRFGGTTALAISCGVNFPFSLYKLVVKGEKEIINNYKINKTFRSLFREEILYAFDRPKDIPKMLLEFFNPFIDYAIEIGDLAPLIGMLKMLRWEIIYKFRARLKRHYQLAKR